jgi:hypothetical protein
VISPSTQTSSDYPSSVTLGERKLCNLDRTGILAISLHFWFLLKTHASNPYVRKLSEFSFERDFPRVTKEVYVNFCVCLHKTFELTGVIYKGNSVALKSSRL